MPYSGNTHSLPAGSLTSNGSLSDAVTQHNNPLSDISACLTQVKGESNQALLRAGTTQIYFKHRPQLAAENTAAITVGGRIRIGGYSVEGWGPDEFVKKTGPLTIRPWHAVSANGDIFELDTLDIHVATFGPAGNKGNGDTDDIVALQAAADYALTRYNTAANPVNLAKRPRIIVDETPFGEGYVVGSTWTVETQVDMDWRGAVWSMAPANGGFTVVLGKDTLGAAAGLIGARWSKWEGVHIRRHTQSDWTNVNDRALVFENGYVTTLVCKYINGFRYGPKVSMSYGVFDFGEIAGAEWGWHVIGAQLPGEFGNSTEIRGREVRVGGVNPGKSRYGGLIEGATPFGIGTIKLTGLQSYELGIVSAQTGNPAGEAIPLTLRGVVGGGVLGVTGECIRTEGNGPIAVRLEGDVCFAAIGVTYTERWVLDGPLSMVDDQTTHGTGNYVYHAGHGSGPGQREVWRSGPLAENAVRFGTGLTYVVGMEAMVDNGAGNIPTFTTHTLNGQTTFTSDGNTSMALASSRVQCRRFELCGERYVTVRIRKRKGVVTTALVKCFNAAGAELTALGAVRSGRNQMPVAAQFNGTFSAGVAFITAAGSNDLEWFDAYLGFSADVATFALAVNSCHELIITSPHGLVRSFASTDDFGDQPMAGSIPVAGTGITYTRGMMVGNFNAASGQPPDWKCTDGTTPTFIALPNLP